MSALTYPNHTYDQIIIGSGSAAAMHLNTLRNYYKTAPPSETMPVSILVIGMGDPWAGARGYSKGNYTENINQARQLFEHGSGSNASMDINPVDRTQWAGTNAQIISEVTQGHSVEAEVNEVIPHGSEAFLVKTTGAKTYRTRKVVIASGAGIETSDREYHMVPTEVSTFIKAHGKNNHVMDLDQFQNGAANSKAGAGKKLAVIGENAGTDAIMEAATRNYAIENVFWFMRRETRPGTALTWDISALNPTFTAEIAGKDKGGSGKDGCVVRTQREVELSPAGNKIRVKHDGGEVDVDFFVYAKGQRGGGLARATKTDSGIRNVPFVDSSIANKLEPIYDINQRFSDISGSGGAWEHVLGIQLTGSTATYGISLVGSAAVQVGRGVKHNYLDAEYADFSETLRDCSEVFHEAAMKAYPDLYRHNKFLAMTTSDKIRDIDMSTIKQREDAFVLSVKQKTELASVAITGSSVSEMLGKAKERGNTNARLARELCYLFQLRVKAAQYYRELSDSGGRNPERPDSLQSAGLGRTLPVTVSDGRLLGGMQRNIAAGNQSYNVNQIMTLKGNNFLEDQQSVALYLAVHYPNIGGEDANSLVSQILNDRKTKGRGFTPQEMGVWDFRLGQKEREAKLANKKSLGFAYNKFF